MLIGADFPKITWTINGITFLEPNALIGDLILTFVSFYIALQLRHKKSQHPFYKWWYLFFVSFGVGFLMGGLGHFLFHYTGIVGRYPAWYMGIISTYFIIRAMGSLLPEKEEITIQKWAIVTCMTSIISETIVFMTVDLSVNISRGLVIPSLYSTLGLGYSLGYLGYRFTRERSSGFKWFWISIGILIPSALVQGLKINIHPWMDRNDISHILLLAGLICYYKGIISISSSESRDATSTLNA
jgi:hypothetical protein